MGYCSHLRFAGEVPERQSGAILPVGSAPADRSARRRRRPRPPGDPALRSEGGDFRPSLLARSAHQPPPRAIAVFVRPRRGGRCSRSDTRVLSKTSRPAALPSRMPAKPARPARGLQNHSAALGGDGWLSSASAAWKFITCYEISASARERAWAQAAERVGTWEPILRRVIGL